MKTRRELLKELFRILEELEEVKSSSNKDDNYKLIVLRDDVNKFIDECKESGNEDITQDVDFIEIRNYVNIHAPVDIEEMLKFLKEAMNMSESELKLGVKTYEDIYGIHTSATYGASKLNNILGSELDD